MCKYSTHSNYCGTAARSLGSKHTNLMFSLLAESTHARGMINLSKGGCLWGVTVLAELPIMDAHQAAVFGPTCWVHMLLHSPGPGQAPSIVCVPGLSGTLPMQKTFMLVPTVASSFSPLFGTTVKPQRL